MNKKRKVSKSFIMLLIAGLLMLSSGKEFLYGGLFIIFGVLGYDSRKSQKLGGSRLWLLVEIPSILIIVLLLILGLLRGQWYERPLSFLIPPVIFCFYYIKSWKIKETLTSSNVV